MRGLKREQVQGKAYSRHVASFTDAWIETFDSEAFLLSKVSHLLQMRGLKPDLIERCQYPCRSHLLQMRGLKH